MFHRTTPTTLSDVLDAYRSGHFWTVFGRWFNQRSVPRETEHTRLPAKLVAEPTPEPMQEAMLAFLAACVVAVTILGLTAH